MEITFFNTTETMVRRNHMAPYEMSVVQWARLRNTCVSEMFMHKNYTGNVVCANTLIMDRQTICIKTTRKDIDLFVLSAF